MPKKSQTNILLPRLKLGKVNEPNVENISPDKFFVDIFVKFKRGIQKRRFSPPLWNYIT